MKVLLVYPGHTHSTYDVAQGYEAALRACGVEVVAFEYHRYLALYHTVLPYWERVQSAYHFDRADAAYHAMAHLIPAVIEERPDWVLVVCGTGMHWRFYDLVYRLGVPVAMMLTESPYEDNLQAQMLRGGRVTLAFTNERTSVEPLATAAPDTTVVYLPHSYDPDRHRPGPGFREGAEGVEVFFFGTLWPERRRIFQSIRNRRDVWIGGYVPPGEADGWSGDRYRVLMDNDALVAWYNSVSLVLNYHRQHLTAESLNPRVYEVAACGTLCLTDYRAELRDVFGDILPTYHDHDTLREQIDYFLSHPTEREERVQAAREAVRDCTFRRRAEEIVIPALERMLG